MPYGVDDYFQDLQHCYDLAATGTVKGFGHFQGIAEGVAYASNAALSLAQTIGKVIAHGTAGGVVSELQGGKFAHGFASAGVTQAFAKHINNIGGGSRSIGAVAGRVSAAALVGGTASELSGGKFVNGAVTGAISRAFNHAVHDSIEAWKRRQVMRNLNNTTIGFLKQYFFGDGSAIDLGLVGLGDDFKNAPSVRAATEDLINSVMQGPVFNLEVADSRSTNVTNVGAMDFTGWPALFSVGDGILRMNAKCVRGSCSFIFETNDRFTDALDINDSFPGNQDIPLFSTPYDIKYKWIELRRYAP